MLCSFLEECRFVRLSHEKHWWMKRRRKEEDRPLRPSPAFGLADEAADEWSVCSKFYMLPVEEG